jgi:hypothetical protein
MVAKKKTTTSSKTPSNIGEVTAAVAAAGQDKSDANAKALKAARDAKIEQDATELTVEKVATGLTRLNLDISRSINSVREIFEAKIAELQTLKDAIDLKTTELEELHGKEIAAQAVADLVREYEEKKAAFAVAQEEARKAWQKEEQDHLTAVRERNDLVLKTRQREDDDYVFQKQVARRNDEEAYRQKVAQRDRERKQTEEDLEKTWQIREEALKKAEAIVAEGKAKLDSFDATVKAEADKVLKIVTANMKSSHDNELKFAKMQSESELKLAQSELESLKRALIAKEAENTDLRANVKRLQEEVREIAVVSMQAQSGKTALDAVQQAITNQGNSKK